MARFDFIKPLIIKDPEITYFNHLLGEFESFEAALARDAVSTAEKPGTQITQAAGQAASTSTQAEKATKLTDQSGEPPGGQAKDAGEAQANAAAGQAAADAVEVAVATRQSAEVARGVIAGSKNKIAELVRKRDDGTLDWNDIFLFELILSNVRPIESLRGKIVSLRSDFRAVAGQVKFDEYMAAKPPDLQSPPDPTDPPDANVQEYERLLREDLKDLLGRLFIQYAILPVREARLKRLTLVTAGLCAAFLLVLIIFIILMSWGGKEVGKSDAGAAAQAPQAQATSGTIPKVPSLAIFVVICAGVMGGLVSAVQRVQPSAREGDSIYNLSMLYHGSYAVFVAPVTGAIFAILLFFMFTGGILEGRFFPRIYTPGVAATPTPTPPPTPTPTPTPATNAARTSGDAKVTTGNTSTTASNTGGNLNRAVNLSSNQATNTNTGANVSTNANAATNTSTNTNAATERTSTNASAPDTSTPADAPISNAAGAAASRPTQSLEVRQFLESGPGNGADYALLLIWSFIAGFAERFVPDSLNRLIAGRQSGG